MTMHAKESIHSSRKLLIGATTAAASGVPRLSLKVRTYDILPRVPLLCPMKGTEVAQIDTNQVFFVDTPLTSAQFH
jgi:hypothetical protein